MKWIPCSCDGFFISVAHPLTALNCGTISPWSDTYVSGLLTRHSCPVLPLPLQSYQSGHSECAGLFVPFRCFLSMAYTPPCPHPLPLPPSPQAPMSPSFSHTTPPALHPLHSTPCTASWPCSFTACLFMLFPGVSAQYPHLLLEVSSLSVPSLWSRSDGEALPSPHLQAMKAFSQHLMQNELCGSIIHIRHHCLFAHLSPH